MRSKYVSHSGAILGGYIQNNEHLFVYSYLSIITPNRYSRRSLLFKMVLIMGFFSYMFSLLLFTNYNHAKYLLSRTPVNRYSHTVLSLYTGRYRYIPLSIQLNPKAPIFNITLLSCKCSYIPLSILLYTYP